MSPKEKTKGVTEEAVTTSQDAWFEFSCATMNKTLSLLPSGSTSQMFGLRRSNWETSTDSGDQDARRDVIWGHVGAGSTASGQTP